MREKIGQFYHIMPNGDVVRKKTGRVLKQQRKADGRCSVNLSLGGVEKRFYVHHLVEMFHMPPRPDNHVLIHKDGDSSNNILMNLRHLSVNKANDNQLRRAKGRAFRGVAYRRGRWTSDAPWSCACASR